MSDFREHSQGTERGKVSLFVFWLAPFRAKSKVRKTCLLEFYTDWFSGWFRMHGTRETIKFCVCRRFLV